MIELKTERLILRRFTQEDYLDLFEYLSDKAVVEFEPYEVYTKDQAIKEAIIRSENESFYAVCLKENNKLIGNIYLNKGEYEAFELGYVFNRNYHGFGYATESTLAIVDYAFTVLGARRIISMCNPLNKPSWKLLERIHMRKEGHLVRNIYFKRNEYNEPIWVDTYMYAILKEEWNNRYISSNYK
jgi:RimJ/RimL family protein N-acetyltransferase